MGAPFLFSSIIPQRGNQMGIRKEMDSANEMLVHGSERAKNQHLCSMLWRE